MRAALIILAASLALAACDTAPVTEATRDAARKVIKPIILAKLPVPGVPVDALADCIIDNAATDELAEIGRAAVFGVRPETTRVVLDVARDPATIKCAAKAVLS